MTTEAHKGSNGATESTAEVEARKASDLVRQAQADFDAGQTESVSMLFDSEAVRKEGADYRRRQIRKALRDRDRDALMVSARLAVRLRG